MAKSYVILNFTDYKNRSTPVNNLAAAFERRVDRKGGSFRIHHMADLFGDIRLARHKSSFHEVQGILDEGWVRTLCLEAAVYRSSAWSSVMNSCRSADKIIFAAHGQPDDTDNVYTEHSMENIRCGSVDGVVCFLTTILNGMQRYDPTITLVVCYAARSSEHHKHHVNATLGEGDIRSSLSFKIFSGLSEFRPHIRLTARTGAVSAEDVGTSLTSETEEAIIAAEALEAEFGGTVSDDLRAAMNRAFNELDRAIVNSALTRTERTEIQNRMDAWLQGNFDRDVLDQIVDDVDALDWSHRSYGASIFWKVGLNATWKEANANAIATLRNLAPRRQRLQQLHTTSKQSLAKYGKFIYERDQNEIVVSRWLAGQLVQVARLNG